tara:strand:+ start:181 stop:531 length:351 start_codon:yes stop_codon:yes gene_type:complete
MKITNKLNSIIKIKLFVLLFLNVNLNFANNKIDPTSNTKHSAADINDFNEKVRLEKEEDNSKKSSLTNYHDIMSTTGDCTASCCAGINSAQKVGDSKKKSNNQKGKKKFRWFSRSK